MSSREMIPVERIERKILVIRGRKVILDSDLADLYGVTTRRLNEQVKRNRARFPADFLFQLTREEKAEVVAICDHLQRIKFSPVLPFAFTEHGAIMAASVLNTRRAVEVSVFVVRAFVRLRGFVAMNRELIGKLKELEHRVAGHDRHIRDLFAAIRGLMPQEAKSVRRIGFRE
jgi:ORF6N domain